MNTDAIFQTLLGYGYIDSGGSVKHPLPLFGLAAQHGVTYAQLAEALNTTPEAVQQLADASGWTSQAPGSGVVGTQPAPAPGIADAGINVYVPLTDAQRAGLFGAYMASRMWVIPDHLLAIYHDVRNGNVPGLNVPDLAAVTLADAERWLALPAGTLEAAYADARNRVPQPNGGGGGPIEPL